MKQPPKLPIFSRRETKIGEGIIKALHSIKDRIVVRHHEDMESFAAEFRYPNTDICLAIVIVSNQEDLTCLLSIRYLFADHRIVLVLPDAGAATMKKALTLYPRYIGYADMDCEEVSSVIFKMLGVQSCELNNTGSANIYGR